MDNLTLQLSTLQTSDRPVLVAELCKLSGGVLDEPSAEFYLELSSWNLSLALNNYLDVTNSTSDLDQTSRLLLIESVKSSHSSKLQVDPHDPLEVLPRQQLKRNLLVTNTGTCTWSSGVYLKLIEGSGDFWSGDFGGSVQVGGLEPTTSTTIALHFTAPHHPGNYNSRWQLSTPEGICFGDSVWLLCIVLDSVELVEQLASMEVDS